MSVQLETEVYQFNIPYGSVIFLTTLAIPSGPAFPLRLRAAGSPGFCESLLRLAIRAPTPLASPLTRLAGVAGGCFEPEAGRLELVEGDRED